MLNKLYKQLTLIGLPLAALLTLNGCAVQGDSGIVSVEGFGGGGDAGLADAMPLTISSVYSGSVSGGPSNSGASLVLTGLTVTPVGNTCKSGITSAVDYVFSNLNTTPSVSPELKVVPNDTACAFTVKSITLSAGSAYTFTNLSIPSANSNNYGAVVKSETIAANTPAYIAAAGYVNLTWAGYGQFNPILKIALGDSVEQVGQIANASFEGVSLAGTSVSGLTIAAPNYFVGTTAGVADPANSFRITYDASFYIMSESLTIARLTASQGGQQFAFITTNLASPLGANCGTVNATTGALTVSGCTYNIVDAAYTNAAVKTTLTESPTTPTASVGKFFSWAYTNLPTGSTGAEFLGHTVGAAIPSYLSQNAIRYLIIRNLDSPSQVPAYQMFVLNAGKK